VGACGHMWVDRGLRGRNRAGRDRLGALAVAANDKADDGGADREPDRDQDDCRLRCDRGGVELAADGRV